MERLVLTFHRAHGTRTPTKRTTNLPAAQQERSTTNHFGMRRQRGATRAPSGAAGQQLPLYDYIYFIFPLPLSLTFLRGSARLRTRRRRGARTRLIAQGGSRQGRKQSTNALVGWGRGGREGGGGGGRGFRRKARPRRRKRRRKPCVAAKPGIFHSLPSPVHILGSILSPWSRLLSVKAQRFLGPAHATQRVRVQLAAQTPFSLSSLSLRRRLPLPLVSFQRSPKNRAALAEN